MKNFGTLLLAAALAGAAVPALAQGVPNTPPASSGVAAAPAGNPLPDAGLKTTPPTAHKQHIVRHLHAKVPQKTAKSAPATK